MTIVIFDNFDKVEACKYAEIATYYLLALGVTCYVKRKSFEKFSKKETPANLILIENYSDITIANFIVTFGGDGTILSAVRLYLDRDIPVMGFNVGKLGFLAEFSVNNLLEELNKLLNKDFKITERFAITTKFGGEELTALNDFTIEKKDLSKMITIKAYSEGQYIGDYRADGLIITTPTGSTAYSLSCGGPLIHPDAKVLCITPICPHSLTLRPLVLPNEKNIELKVFSPTGQAVLSTDGHSQQTIHSGDIINFSISSKRIRIIVPLESTYFGVIRKKFLWAEYAFEEKQQ